MDGPRYTLDEVEQRLAAFPEAAHGGRQWYWIIAAIMSWVAFWHAADEFADSPYTQSLTWLAIGLAIWVASNC